MAGAPGKDNKTLVVTCAACKKEVAAVDAVGLTVAREDGLTMVAACCACYDSGWRPEGYTGF